MKIFYLHKWKTIIMFIYFIDIRCIVKIEQF